MTRSLLPPRVVASLTLILVALLGAGGVAAASGPCAVVEECVAPQVCRLDIDGGTCVWDAFDPVTLADAITAANADIEVDLIAVPAGEIHFDFPVEDDPFFGPAALPPIASPIVIVGEGVDDSVLDIDNDIRLFLVRGDAATDFPASLSLRALTLRDARPGENVDGVTVGAGAVTITAEPTGGALPALVAEDTVFISGSGASAGAIDNEGAPLELVRCLVAENDSDGAAAIRTTSGATVRDTVVRDNFGATAALTAVQAEFLDAAGVATAALLDIRDGEFVDNHGDTGGGVLSLATTAIFGGRFARNQSDAPGGAVAAAALHIQGGQYEDNVASVGGAVAVTALEGAPADAAAQIGDATFARNVAFDSGGAIYVDGVAASLADLVVTDNRARAGGGVAFQGVAGDAELTSSVFRGNIARPSGRRLAHDDTVDERGDDDGGVTFSFAGAGSALLIDDAPALVVNDNCFVGNGAAAVALAADSVGVDVRGNWWGDAAGANGAGDRAAIAPGLDVTAPLTSAPAACAQSPIGDYPTLLLPATVSGTATIRDDVIFVEEQSGVEAIVAASAPLILDMRTGAIRILVFGINDLDVEGTESATLALAGCGDGACNYDTPDGGPLVATFTIADNGDAEAAGEGEGEGDDCPESLELSKDALSFAASGADAAPSEDRFTIDNTGPCDVVLLRPFVQAGASRGFGVQPLLPDELVIAAGGARTITATYARPEDDVDEPPTGKLRIETAGGTLVELPMALESGCACHTSRDAPPPLVAIVVVAIAGVLRRRRLTG